MYVYLLKASSLGQYHLGGAVLSQFIIYKSDYAREASSCIVT